MTVFINSDAHGYGDLCVAAFLSECNPQFVHHATRGKAELLRIFRQRVTSERPDKLVDLHQHYRWELEHPETPRIVSRARWLGVSTWQRPPVAAWSPVANRVLVFPCSLDPAREWNGFVSLVAMLQAGGLQVTTITEFADCRFSALPDYRCGLNWHQIVELMLRSCLVIGNDSGACNVAGVLNVPALAIMGTTFPKIFTHVPSVRTIRADSLATISPEQVLHLARYYITEEYK